MCSGAFEKESITKWKGESSNEKRKKKREQFADNVDEGEEASHLPF